MSCQQNGVSCKQIYKWFIAKKEVGGYTPHCKPPNSLAAKFASQRDAHVQTDTHSP